MSRRDAGAVIIARAWRLTGPACSGAALAVVLYGLHLLDLPVVHYVRSVTIHLPWDQLTIPWMALTSQAGDWIGEGSHLLAISALLLAAGWWWSAPTVKAAGVQTLIAHGMAALISNGLKHLLGRPRPKFVHSGEWRFTPSWASGWDSFPSGHTTASFAVATVLARRFPWSAPLGFAIAAFVGLSRVLRGSHFPTDVLGGAVIGILSGFLASAPLKDWRLSLAEGLRHAAIGMTAAFAVLWTFARPADEGLTGMLLIGLGVVAMASGLWLRRGRWIGRESAARNEPISRGLIAYGLASMTTAPLVLASVGFACLAYWFQDGAHVGASQPPSKVRRMMGESALLAGVLMALTILFAGRGVLPLR
jgi:membrane-associated phospholipid phosphatase